LSAAFSLDGARIVTASADNTARLWDAATGQPIVVLKGHDGIVISAAFSPDGARVVTASRDGTARLWDARTPKGDIFHIACAWLPDTDLANIAHDYGLTDLAPICQGDPPLPDPPLP
jgi:WD40 repeat protein